MTEKEFKMKVLSLTSLVYPMAVRMLRNEEAARDAVQTSMLKIWENRKKLARDQNPKAFVFKVVRNTCLDEIKRKKADRMDEVELAAHFKTSDDSYDAVEAVNMVKIIVNELPDGQREVIQLRDIEGLEFNEIADILAYDLPYIRVLLSRARKTIKQKLQKIYAYETIQKNGTD